MIEGMLRLVSSPYRYSASVVAGIYFLGMFPVYVVELDLYEIPFYFFVAGEQIVEDFDISVVGET